MIGENTVSARPTGSANLGIVAWRLPPSSSVLVLPRSPSTLSCLSAWNIGSPKDLLAHGDIEAP